MKIFDALNEHFEGTLTTGGIPVPNELQQKVLQRAKQGGDLLLSAPDNSGKTMAAMMSALQKVPERCEGSPRVIYVCPDPEKAKSLVALMTLVSRRKDLMIELAHDKGNMIEQRIHIFEGADIVIGNPKRIYDLYIQNGLNTGELKLFILDNAEQMMKESTIRDLKRIAGSLPKCQRFIFTTEINSKLEKILDDFLINPLEINH